MMRRIIRILWILFFLWSGCPINAVENRPNILLIMADDMGYSDLGCFGGEIKTPNLDNLANNGIRYRQMYNTSKCTTSRSSLLTGRYVTAGSWTRNYNQGPLIGEVLKAAGYRTLWSGKNHSSIRPTERGFDRFYGFQGGACNYWNPGDTMPDGSPFPRIKAYEWMVDDQWLDMYMPEASDYYMTDAITDNAIGWLSEYEKEEKPFFLYLAYNAPHWPLHAREKDIERYEGVYDAGYQQIRKARYERMIEKEMIDPATTKLFPEQIAEWDSLSDDQKLQEAERMQIHAAMVDCMDQNIGRVVRQLKASGKWKNTLVFFLVDNGASHEQDQRAYQHYKPHGEQQRGNVMTYECIGPNWARVANTPFAKHKMTSHEGGICAPCIAHWPEGILQKNRCVDTPVHLVDFMRTFIELGEARYPNQFNGRKAAPLHGISMIPSFTGKPLVNRTCLIGNQFAAGKAVREGPWKLVSFGRKNPQVWELYNLDTDRSETVNLAKAKPDKVEVLERKYAQWFNNAN